MGIIGKGFESNLRLSGVKPSILRASHATPITCAFLGIRTLPDFVIDLMRLPSNMTVMSARGRAWTMSMTVT